MSTKSLTRVAILSALCIVLRYAFSSLPNIQLITAIFLVTALMFSLGEAMSLAAITMLVSSFLLGFGPWVIWQILSFSFILIIWSILTRLGKYDEIASVSVLGLGSQILIAGALSLLYGILIDMSSAFLYGASLVPYVLAGMSFNSLHALSTMVCYPVILAIFRRIMR